MDRFGNEVSCEGALWQPGDLSRAEFVSARLRSLRRLPGNLAMSVVLSIRCGGVGRRTSVRAAVVGRRRGAAWQADYHGLSAY